MQLILSCWRLLFSVHVENKMEMKVNRTALFTCQKEVAVCCYLLIV